MRLTINIDDRFGNEIKRMASAKGVSVSRFISGVLEYSLVKERKCQAIQSVLELAKDESLVSEDALEQIEAGRSEDEGRI